MLSIWLMIPFTLQAIVMTVDEFYYHHKRGLPLWERIGHPLDTLSVLACFGWLVSYPYSSFNLSVYIGLSIFSCFFITKDEWVHADLCVPGEQWAHSILFVLHPLVLGAAGFTWYCASVDPSVISITESIDSAQAHNFLKLQLSTVTSVLLYQSVYWNFFQARRASHVSHQQ